jgi:3-dehydroquinate synthetase
MALAFAFSAQRGLLPRSEAERVERHLATAGLPVHLSSVAGGLPDADRLMQLIAQDKKVRRGKLTFILARGIGASFIAPDVDAAEVRAFLVDKLAEQ